MSLYKPGQLADKVRAFPRRSLIQRPTPFQPLESLSAKLGGPSLVMKREDLTGLAFGGNKSRKLEYIIADVLRQEADVLITWASLQSNWCLQSAAAARKFGIKPMLLLFKTSDMPAEYDGNLLLDFLLDSEIHIHEAEQGKVVKLEYAEELLEELRRQEVGKGHKPYVAPLGGSLIGGSMQTPLGAIGYVDAFLEMVEQADALSLSFDAILLASGSGSTQAGLLVGAKALAPRVRIIGVSVSEKSDSYTDLVLRIARDTRQALKLDVSISREDVIVLDDYIQDGYGIVNADVSRALRLVGETEGIFLDPVYTGKAMVGLIDLIKKGCFQEDSSVIFMHTGGTAALFPNKSHLVRLLSS
jgi:D-cysteine desulfhydrase family pyridoxal phosphate-dependent enzyme